jgi:hypothetical protein
MGEKINPIEFYGLGRPAIQYRIISAIDRRHFL